MEGKPGIDRHRHAVDVLEQVMKGVQAERGPAPHVVDHGVRPWAGGVLASAVQVEVIDDDSDET